MVLSAISSLASPQQRKRWASSGTRPPILRYQPPRPTTEPEPDVPEPTETDLLREIVQTATRARKITPQAVAAFAALHIQDDNGQPIKPAAHHRLWLELLCDWRIRKLLIIAPPESAKTTWAISAYLGCRIGMFPQHNVIIGSATADIATARSMALRGMVDTDAWRETFPGVQPVRANDGLRWGTNQWSVAPYGIPFPGRLHPTIAAAGTGGTIEGGRGDEVVGDDLLSRSVSQSPTERKKVEDWAHASLLSRRKAVVGRAVVIGTSHHPDDYLSHIRAAGDWVVCHMNLLGDGPNVYATVTYPDDVDWNRLGELVAGAKLDLAA